MAFWSGVDNADEKADQLYLVVGKLKDPVPQFKLRARAAGIDVVPELAPEAIFDGTFEDALRMANAMTTEDLIPDLEEQMSRIHLPTPVKGPEVPASRREFIKRDKDFTRRVFSGSVQMPGGRSFRPPIGRGGQISMDFGVPGLEPNELSTILRKYARLSERLADDLTIEFLLVELLDCGFDNELRLAVAELQKIDAEDDDEGKEEIKIKED